MKRLSLVLLLLFAPVMAMAQSLPILGGSASNASVSTSSSTLAIPVITMVSNGQYTFPVLTAQNSGSTVMHVRLGSSSTTAATTDLAIPPGGCQTFSLSQSALTGGVLPTNIAALMESGSATLYIAQWSVNGVPGCPGASGSATVSGTVTTTNASIGPVNTTAPTSATEIGVTDGSGKLQGVSAANPMPGNAAQLGGTTIATGNGTTGAGTQRVTISSDSTGVVGLNAGSQVVGKVGIDQTTPGVTNGVVQTDTGATSGSLGALNATVTFPINGDSSAYASITGTFVGGVQFYGTNPATGLMPLNTSCGGLDAPVTTNAIITTTGCHVEIIAAFTSIVAKMTSYTSGSATVSLNASPGVSVTQALTKPSPVTPVAGTASAITTGGVAITLVTGPVNGCWITNPLSATDQGIATAEAAQINGVTTATGAGNGTNSTLQPGQSWGCVPGQKTNVSAIAATTGHAFAVEVW